MSGFRIPARVPYASPLAALLLIQSAHAQSSPSPAEELADQVVVTGTRVANRSALETAVPVDVISGESFRNLGVPEVTQALSVALPSYNFPRPGLADGTDTIRPATLRGLSPDQTLVLVNGKRRHSASLVNVNGTVGRGASAADLNTIPGAMLKSIEVLRDGASAQYGSDAIAGVINLRLREDRDGGEAMVSYGVRDTSYDIVTGKPPAGAPFSVSNPLSRSLTDGQTLTASLWKGLSLGSDGFLTVAAEYKNQKRTERGGFDVRAQYPVAGGVLDPREASINRFNAWYGEPQLEQKTVFLNTGYTLGNGARLYGWAGYQNRDARSAGFYRIASDSRNVPSIYPDGFLPIIAPTVDDYSAAAGVAWNLGEWAMDTSLVYGLNKMDFTIENTLNRSIGATSKTQFDAGGFDYGQLVFNFSGVRGVDVGLASPLNVAVGLEARREGYSISAGEPDSYRNGGELLPTNPPSPAPSGSQVFPGFRPANVVDAHRNEIGVYVDLEARLTEKFLASAALRGEHYSDFGSSLSGKIAGRYDFTDNFALRGSVQNGFRAPSLQQQHFATTSTNFLGGVAFDITTFPAGDPIATALGAKPLDAEKSVNYSLGTVIRFDKLDITIDAYRINIDDRIVLSENLTSAAVRDFLKARGFANAGGGRFFINGVDTKTDGVDLAMTYPFELGNVDRVSLTLAANFNQTDVKKVPVSVPLAALNPSPVLFDRFNIRSFEEGTPDNKFTAAATWGHDQWGATLRATRYGKVLSPDTAATFASAAAPNAVVNDVELGAKTLVDLEGRVAIARRIKLALGAENVFDVYPDPNPVGVNVSGTQSFSNYSPFGRSGRFLYGRVSFEF
ncbi:MAG: TonB-dependent receptor [Gammaproteobacteria bacterium]